MEELTVERIAARIKHMAGYVVVLAKWLAAGFPKVEIVVTQQHKEAFSYL